MREHIASCSELATQAAENARTNAKTWYDRKARTRHFDAGDFVLVLLPVSGKQFARQIPRTIQNHPTIRSSRLPNCYFRQT